MPGYTFHLIPHTHWDREWYLPQSVFLARLVSTLDQLLDLLGSEPESTFLLDGQTVLLEDYLQVRPEQAQRVGEMVRSGRLQVGPWYVLADELIPSDESLIRNLLAGRRDCERLGGGMEVLYSPDAFGHPATWPQLAGEFGIRFGVAWRGLGGEPGQEHDFYRWRAPDGREVLLYHLPPDGYEIGAVLPASAERLPRMWPRVRSALVGRAATRHVAVFIGADHHAAHPGVVELRNSLAQLEPASEFQISRLQDFFTAAAAEASAVPVISGELRWSYGYTWTLQGVHSTRAPLKRRHAHTELSYLGFAEPLAALCMMQGKTDHRALLQHGVRLLVQSQFHDSIAGCTSDEVARRVEVRLQDARNLASEITRGSLDELIGNDPDRVRQAPESGEPQLVLWNPVPRRRQAVVVADFSWFRRDVLVGPPGERLGREGRGSRPFHLIAPEEIHGVQSLGTATAQERLDAPHHYPDQDEVDITRVAFAAPAVEGLGFLRLDPGAGERPITGAASAEGHILRNEFLEVRIAPNGGLDLTDRRTRQRYPGLFTLETSLDEGDTYTYCPPANDHVRQSRGPVRLRILARGPLVAATELSWQLAAGRSAQGAGPGVVGVRLIVSLYSACRALRCTYHLDNQALNHRLRLRLPTGTGDGAAVAGAQFGSIQRAPISSNGPTYPRESPVATAPGHRYVGRASRSRGLAVFAPGFFEYELEPHGDLLITLLRSVGQLSRGDLATRPGHAGWPTPTPMAQCLGPERLQLACAPMSQDQLESGTAPNEMWQDLFLPIQPVWRRQASPLSPVAEGIRLEGKDLVFSALKPAEDGNAVVLRCYNVSDRPAAGAWHFGCRVRTAHRAQADERVLYEIKLDEASRTVPFHAAPHEIVTIMVTIAQPG